MELKNDERDGEVDCILRILNSFLEKFKMCLILPQLVRDPRKFIKICQKDTLKASHLIDMQNYFKHKKQDVEVLIYLNENIVRYSKKFLKYNREVSYNFDDNSQTLIESFDLINNITMKRLSKSAVLDLSEGKKIHKIQRHLSELEKSIAEKKEFLRKERILTLWKIAFKGSLIHKYEEALAFQKWDNNMRIKQEIVRSSKTVQDLQDVCNKKLQAMEREVIQKRIKYSRLLRENITAEKDAHTEKKKLLFQLQTYLKKYDQNIGEKVQDNFNLKKHYEEKKKIFENFLIEYKQQEEVFHKIQSQKEKEEQLLFEEKLMVFMMSRAARAIQIRWRRHRKDQKKKGKKGKGKGKKK